VLGRTYELKGKNLYGVKGPLWGEAAAGREAPPLGDLMVTGVQSAGAFDGQDPGPIGDHADRGRGSDRGPRLASTRSRPDSLARPTRRAMSLTRPPPQGRGR
jgi:hypothetical protein